MGDKKRIDVMVDIETLGTGLDAVILQIAAQAFDIEKTLETVKVFDGYADISKLTDADGVVGGASLKWWLETDAPLLKDIIARGEGVAPSELIKFFHDFLTEIAQEYDDVILWGNGILFDNAIIRHKFEQLGLDYPIKYWNDRDVRTIAELASVKAGVSVKDLKESVYDPDLRVHDAYNDVANQVRLVRHCYRELTKGSRLNE